MVDYFNIVFQVINANYNFNWLCILDQFPVASEPSPHPPHLGPPILNVAHVAMKANRAIRNRNIWRVTSQKLVSFLVGSRFCQIRIFYWDGLYNCSETFWTWLYVYQIVKQYNLAGLNWARNPKLWSSIDATTIHLALYCTEKHAAHHCMVYINSSDVYIFIQVKAAMYIEQHILNMACI